MSTLQLKGLADLDLAAQASELAQKARQAILTTTDVGSAVSLTHDIKAVRDRLSRVMVDHMAAWQCEFQWAMCWLDAARQAGALIAAGQESGAIMGPHGGAQKSSNTLLLDSIGLDRMTASRWQRLAELHPEDWRTWEQECLADERIPTLSSAMTAWKLLHGEPDKDKPSHECPICGGVHPIADAPAKELPAQKDAIRKVAELAFREVRPVDWPKDKKELGKRFFQPLRAMCEMCEWDPERVVYIIFEADAQATQGGLSVSAPASLLKTATALVGELRRGSKKRNQAMSRKAEDFVARHLAREGQEDD